MSTARYGLIARFYDLLDLPFELRRYRTLRPAAFEGLSGRLLDAGAGTGRNIASYPEGSEIVGIDLSPAMLNRARRRRDALGRDVDLLEMDVRATAFADDSFDGVAATFLFCVLDETDQAPALRELARITRPGGEIRLIEYAYSADPWTRFVMRLWAPWVRLAYGAGFARRTEEHIGRVAGLELVERRFLFRDIIKLLVIRVK
jgi:ubiquinone/menaquinone biosynthesis C-methylase UbiE